ARTVAARTLDAWFGIFDFDAAADRLEAFRRDGASEAALLARSVAEERFPEMVLVLSRMSTVRAGTLVAWMTGREVDHFLV
ncbi:hypothetical protein J8J40_33820, partial [Mycobacterium tuberculosis]|nr:hypothetical protein [Mycobacterium tuberculosis]